MADIEADFGQILRQAKFCHPEFISGSIAKILGCFGNDLEQMLKRVQHDKKIQRALPY
jgi:hypothetical protein